MGQIRNLLVEYAVLPLGSPTVKAKLEANNLKTLMLYGPSGAGKTCMVEAIANELGALLIDISPKKLAGVFPGKKEWVKLPHLIYKIAAENVEAMPKGNPAAPVIVYMDECDKFFEKAAKKAKVDKNGPTRFKKDLVTYKNKAFKPCDRVLFIGCSSSPDKGDLKQFKDFFDKFIHLPYPDYPARLLLWKHMVSKQIAQCAGESAPPLDPFFDFGTLARISEGFSAGAIERVVKKTLTAKRCARLTTRVLQGSEFLNSLALEATRQELQHSADAAVFTEFTDAVTGLADRRKKINDLNNPEAADDKKGKKKKK